MTSASTGAAVDTWGKAVKRLSGRPMFPPANAAGEPPTPRLGTPENDTRYFPTTTKMNSKRQSKSTRFHFLKAGAPPSFGALLAIGCLSVAALFGLQYEKTLSLLDEGYLWYGAQRTALGEVPLKDFMSYDPGRYYLSAAYLVLVGDRGIVPLRVVLALVQAAGLVAALSILAKAFKQREPILLFFAMAVILTWMVPRHKMFDISTSIALIAALSWLIEQPSPRRYFVSGVVVGLAAIIGRNHGFYGAISFGMALVLRAVADRDFHSVRIHAVAWIMGLAAGYSPILIMIAIVPNFSKAFWHSIQFLFQQKATNIPLPVPWPWQAFTGSTGVLDMTEKFLIGIFFLSLLVSAVVAPAGILRNGATAITTKPQLAASSLLVLPYAHFAFSRADVAHLAQGIFPMLIVAFILLQSTSLLTKWILAVALLAASLLATSSLHPVWQCRAASQCVPTQVSGTRLFLQKGTAKDVQTISDLAEHYAPDAGAILATPFLPGAYSLLERKSPVWEIYALFPRSPEFELQEIERIRQTWPHLVIINKTGPGGQERAFSKTHPLTQKFIEDHYEYLPQFSDTKFLVYTRESPQLGKR